MAERILDRMQQAQWERLHADYCWNVIEWQGNTLIWKVQKRYSVPCPDSKRGTVKGFSRASRLRFMKQFGRINIMENMPYLWMTLTYPDDVRLRDRWIDLKKIEKMDRERYLDIEYLNITQHRWVFWRYLEKYLEKKVPGVWRIEWVPRKSGVFKGQMMPHLHILLMQQNYLAWQEVKWMWMNTLGERFVNVDVRACYDRISLNLQSAICNLQSAICNLQFEP